MVFERVKENGGFSETLLGENGGRERNTFMYVCGYSCGCMGAWKRIQREIIMWSKTFTRCLKINNKVVSLVLS